MIDNCDNLKEVDLSETTIDGDVTNTISDVENLEYISMGTIANE